MHIPIAQKLLNRDVILASASPQRKAIFDKLGIQYRVIPSTFPEDFEKGDPKSYCQATAWAKTRQVFEENISTNPILIGADTVIEMDGKIFEKPKDAEHARSMLKEFSGKEHSVFTAVCIKTKTQELQFIEETKVKFGNLSNSIIDAYVASNDPFNKAGGYGYQSLGGLLVERIDGCYYNVIGFPLFRFIQELHHLN